jgi:predicted ArsR family transcriptional regulator
LNPGVQKRQRQAAHTSNRRFRPRGRHSQGEIARSIGLSTAALVPHLKNLVALGYLERVFPLVPGRPPRTSVLYRVADPAPGIMAPINAPLITP